MMRRRSISAPCALAAALAAVPAAAQAPSLLGYQGRLLRSDGTAATGTATVAFGVFSAETGGTALWSETQTLGLSDGYYSTFLGLAGTPPDGLFDGGARWLEVRVGSETLSPRQRIGSVAFALTARSLRGGAADATSLLVDGQTVVDGDGRLAGNARYSAGAGVTIDEASQTVSLQACPSGQILLHDDMTWGCAAPNPGTVTAVSAAAPLSVAAGSTTPQISLARAGSASSGYLSSDDWSAFNAKFGALTQCGGDLAGPLAAPSVVRLQSRAIATTAPTDGQVLKWNAIESLWKPAPDANAGGTVTNVSVQPPLTAWNGSTLPQISLAQAGASADGFLASSDWSSFNAKYDSATQCTGDLAGTYAAPLVAKLQGIPVVTAVPGGAQVLRFDGTAWAPASLQIGDVGGLSSGYLDLTGAQTITGAKSFSTAPTFGTPLAVAGGGTGSTAAPANSVFAGPASGSSDGAPGFRALVASDIPGLDASRITGGTLAAARGGTGTSAAFASGSVVFAGAAGAYSQNALLRWDESNTRLGVGTSAPAYRLDVRGGDLNVSGNVYVGGTLSGSLNAGDLSSGTLPDARVSGTYSQALAFSNAGNVFAGSGALLTSLDAGALSSGTVPNGRLASGYSQAISFTNTSNVFAGDGSALRGVVASGLSMPVDGSTDTSCTQGGLVRWNGSHFQGCTGVYWANLDNVPPPVVTGIQPASGDTLGGLAVTILGSNFQTLATVSIGGNAATSVVVQSGSRITAVTPASTVVGAVDVKVVNPDFLAGALAGAFTYRWPAPRVTGANPTSGISTGGTQVTIAGSYFQTSPANPSVTIGGATATVQSATATQIVVLTPARSAGARDIVVTNADSQSVTSTGGFTYLLVGSSAATAGSTCKYILDNGGSVGDGQYWIAPNGSTAFQAYCDMSTNNGGWMVFYAVSGAAGEQPLVSDSESSGNPLSYQAYNLNRTKKMAIAAVSSETLFRRSSSLWGKTNAAIFNSSLNTGGSHLHQSVTFTISDGSSASAYQGYSIVAYSGGGDFGISLNPDGGTCSGSTSSGFDHHSTGTYHHLNCGCQRQYLYSYSATVNQYHAGYKVNTGLGAWGSTAGCDSSEGGMTMYVGMR